MGSNIERKQSRHVRQPHGAYWPSTNWVASCISCDDKLRENGTGFEDIGHFKCLIGRQSTHVRQPLAVLAEHASTHVLSHWAFSNMCSLAWHIDTCDLSDGKSRLRSEKLVQLTTSAQLLKCSPTNRVIVKYR